MMNSVNNALWITIKLLERRLLNHDDHSDEVKGLAFVSRFFILNNYYSRSLQLELKVYLELYTGIFFLVLMR